MDLKTIEESLLHLEEYPIEKWNPQLCEGVRFDIDSNSSWFYNNSKIERLSMIRLFSKLLKFENGNYFVVTPSEKIPVFADKEIYSIIDFRKEKGDYYFKTNTEEWIKLTKLNPLSVEIKEKQPYPRLSLKTNVYGLLTRSLFYNLISEAEADRSKLYIKSDGTFFFLN